MKPVNGGNNDGAGASIAARVAYSRNSGPGPAAFPVNAGKAAGTVIFSA
jgi:hypothetical protein